MFRHRIVVPTSVGLLALSAPFLALSSSGGSPSISPTSFSAELEDEEVVTDTITVTIPADTSSPKVDIYILADTTGSMGSVISSLRTDATTLTSALYDDVDADLRIGIGNYKDFPFDSYAFDHQIAPQADTNESSVLGQIATWSASGGFDGSEGQFFALNRLANDTDPAGGSIGWRTDAKKIVVWFGDAPGHDSVCTAVSGLSTDITEASLTAELQDEDITVLAIGTRTGYFNALDDNPTSSANNYTGRCTIGGTSGQATRISTATGGSYTAGVNNTDIVDTIIDLVGAEVNEINSLKAVPSSSLAPYVNSVSPSSYGPIDLSTSFEDDFDIEFEGICGEVEETVTGTIDIVGDGAVVGTQAVTLKLEACNAPPVAVCEDIVLEADETCSACGSIDGGTYDPDGDELTITEDPSCDYGLGDTEVDLTAEDPFGATDTCSATVTVVDVTAPTIDCGSPATITPPDAPISFTATSDDNCGVDLVEVTAYDCWTLNGAGKRIDKKASCIVSFEDDVLTIDDSGGVGDIIEWEVTATDESGNTTTETCSIEVLRPSGGGKGKSKK